MELADRYLDRIAFRGDRSPTLATLTALMRAHLRAVPFENLDIALGRPLSLEREALIDKIIERRRGGFCYELNGLFADLLDALGFSVDRVSARVYSNDEPGPDRDHLALIAHLDDGRRLVDVGFGAAFETPLSLDGDAPARHTVRPTDGGWIYLDGDRPQYVFTETPLALGDFEAMCRYHQTSPASHFTRKVVCTRLTDVGRVTLSRTALKTTTPQGVSEVEVSPAEWPAALRQHFGFELPYPAASS